MKTRTKHLSKTRLFTTIALCALAGTLQGQVIQVRDAKEAKPVEALMVSGQVPAPSLQAVPAGDVRLLPGLFRERREATKAYMLRLKTEDLLQNHYLEAGLRVEKALDQMHLGWEAPHCQLRGHFVGHWLSAAAHFSATDHDALMAARAGEVVKGLARCQELNGGRWVGSIPEKFFTIMTEGKDWIWSPQYTVHKTMTGLHDAHAHLGDKEALAIETRSADWFYDWSGKLVQAGRSELIYGGECAGMLELWANLYGVTKDPRHLELASRYAMPDLFRKLLAGADALTDDHANASIPWIQGAARVHEITGDTRYRRIVEEFWRQAVETRGMFATTGANAGEFWIPPQRHAEHLGARTQEHCTVYNMIRVAQYLFAWTGEAKYADYIERALYNGILAQQNPWTGNVAYFLPTQPGAKKVWGSETKDFWCCHGTLVQAQAMTEGLIYHRSPGTATIAQFIASKASLELGDRTVRLTQGVDTGGRNPRVFTVELTAESDKPGAWTLRLRQPSWASGPASITIDGESVHAEAGKDGFIALTREWKGNKVKVQFPKQVVRVPLPGDAGRFALMDGPVVLAGLTETEPELAADAQITPMLEHLYADGRTWQTSHYLIRTTRGTVEVRPLHEIADEKYTLHFAVAR